ncbi:hypothetical protein BD779DRAFT_437059 [Infundibulicybe gibba]|nr:hypothetical protein BD779DRAFT_437059 [Infundibulicybe gibba]
MRFSTILVFTSLALTTFAVPYAKGAVAQVGANTAAISRQVRAEGAAVANILPKSDPNDTSDQPPDSDPDDTSDQPPDSDPNDTSDQPPESDPDDTSDQAPESDPDDEEPIPEPDQESDLESDLESDVDDGIADLEGIMDDFESNFDGASFGAVPILKSFKTLISNEILESNIHTAQGLRKLQKTIDEFMESLISRTPADSFAESVANALKNEIDARFANAIAASL